MAAASTGVPSVNVTFGRRWNVQTLLSALASHVCASAPSSSVALLPLRWTRASYVPRQSRPWASRYELAGSKSPENASTAMTSVSLSRLIAGGVTAGAAVTGAVEAPGPVVTAGPVVWLGTALWHSAATIANDMNRAEMRLTWCLLLHPGSRS